MDDLSRGLYEILVTETLKSRLEQLDTRRHAHVSGLRVAEAADRLALHLARIVERAVESLNEKDRVRVGVQLARELAMHIDAAVQSASAADDVPIASGEVLRAILGRQPDGSLEQLDEPLIPLLDTALLTNAPGEPRVGNQLLTEIHSSDAIDIVMAFIRRSGIVPLKEALRRHCENGRSLRVLTTTYTGSTERHALELLRDLGADVRVSYDLTSTRLHAKAWLFHRRSGFSTAYIGSSNLTHSAQVSGLEWNVRVSGVRNPGVIDKMSAVFESYWNSAEFVEYDADEFASNTEEAARRLGGALLLSPVELRPEPYQERMLELIALSRQQGHHRNLLVSATGTGKTVMAAVDYARLRRKLPRARLLVVAHREEILTQSLMTFRQAVRDASFGELWVGAHRPSQFEYLFASIQSLRSSGMADLPPDRFDVVIIDEFHHAAAPSYKALLEHVRPVELLGLTATPERSDGLPVLQWFDNRIAAELRLWDAIDQHRLSPFLYYGIHDGLDLRDIPWRRGQGYDVEALSNLLTANDVWARRVLSQVHEHVGDIGSIRALGFCVSVDHARFMAKVFSNHGVAATAVWGDSPDDERRDALKALAEKRINVLFSVDLFNEGIDVPDVDTLLFLRPTDSPTLFLQQLGRGLRRSEGKTVCTVFDFVGQHRREFRFDRRFRALMGGTRRDLENQVKQGFPFLPAGCHIELDRVASEIVLTSIRNAVPSRWADRVEELRQYARGCERPTLGGYLAETGLELEDIYNNAWSWSDLCQAAGVAALPDGPHERELRRVCGRMLHVDDEERIETFARLLSQDGSPALDLLTERERRLCRGLVASMCSQVLPVATGLRVAAEVFWAHPQVRAELIEILDVLRNRVDHVHHRLETDSNVPLNIHARYSRIEILAAFDVGNGGLVGAWQTGVYWADNAKADLLAFTFDKTSGQFSPTTRYRDFAINPELVHWESQSVTRAESDTGRRYQTHCQMGTSIQLFARLRADDRAFWFLGPADYVSHVDERPMKITWRLHHPLPGDLFASFAAAVA